MPGMPTLAIKSVPVGVGGRRCIRGFGGLDGDAAVGVDGIPDHGESEFLGSTDGAANLGSGGETLLRPVVGGGGGWAAVAHRRIETTGWTRRESIKCKTFAKPA